MKKQKIKKKAEITSGQIVLIVILLVSFIVILFVLYKSFTWNDAIDRETCHQSIVYRSSVNYGFIKSSKVVPLKCQTEKICLTMSGNDCIQVGKPTKDNPVTTVKLDKNPIIARQQVMNKLAETMYDCHSMLGEGQLLFMPNKVDWGEKYWTEQNYCLICARMVFDEEARLKLDDIRYTELYQNLWNKVAPNKKTYLEYLHPDWKDWRSIATLFSELKNNGLPQLKDISDINDWKINMSQEGGFAITAQIAPKSYWMVFIGVGAGLGATAIGAAIIGAPVTVTLIGAGAIGSAIFWYNSPTGDFVYSPPAIIPYDLKNLQSIKCDSFETAP